MRPVGHITDLINELTRWKKNRERKNLREVAPGVKHKHLDSEPLTRAISYLEEYRTHCAENLWRR